MMQAGDVVRTFFEDYERGINAREFERLGSQYADSFMFAGPQGVQVVKKDDFLKVLPRRHEFFKQAGLQSSKIHALEETRLDDRYLMVKAYWKMHFQKDLVQPVVADTSATYILFQQADSLRIVFQLDHQDLTTTAQALGFLPAQT